MEKVEKLQVEYRIRKRLSSLPDICSRYVDWLKKTKKPQTVLEYIKDVGLFSDYLKEKAREQNQGFGEICFTQLTTDDINQFLFCHMPKHEKVFERLNGKEVKQEFENGIKGKRRKLSALRSFSRFLLIEEKILKEDICMGIELERNQDKKLVYLDTHTQRLLLDAMERYSEDEFQKVRNQLITMLFLTTGMKTNELLALDIQDVDMEAKRIRIVRKEEEWISLIRKVQPLLNKYMQLRREIHIPMGWHDSALFISIRNKRLNRRTIHYIFQRYESLIECTFSLTPQILRNTFVKETLLEEGDVKALTRRLGNTDHYATKRQYAKEYKQP